MADFRAFKIEVLTWLSHCPLAEALHLMEGVLFFITHHRLLLEQWHHWRRQTRLLPTEVLRHTIIVQFFCWHRKRFEKTLLFTWLKLTDLVFQLLLCLERLLLNWGYQFLLLFDNLLKLTDALIVALLLVAPLEVLIIDWFDIRVNLFNLVQRGSSIERQRCIVYHLAKGALQLSYTVLLRLLNGVQLVIDLISLRGLAFNLL